MRIRPVGAHALLLDCDDPEQVQAWRAELWHRRETGELSAVEIGPLALRPGPRHDWFTPAALDLVLNNPYAISPASNRVGARLVGAALPRAVAGELPSEGLVLGAVQVPPNGQPLIFLADRPTTGGYPVIGVVDDVTPLAQARPGTTVTFHGPQR